tara:strand:- start:1816 stop:2241 length:426 start_codon:yes stop_codon:yes gene_type:complete
MISSLLDAMVTYLNHSDRGFTTSFTAAKKWVPIYQAEGITSTLTVEVFAGEERRQRTDRTDWTIDREVGIVVRQRLDDFDDSDTASLTNFVEDMRDEIGKIETLSGHTLVAMDDTQIFDVETYEQLDLFAHVTMTQFQTIK